MVDVPLHGIVKGHDVACISAGHERRQIVHIHCVNCASAAASGAGVASALEAVFERNGHRDSLEMVVVAVHGVSQDFAQGYGKISRGQGLDGVIERAAFCLAGA
jgi:hypothetical protein